MYYYKPKCMLLFVIHLPFYRSGTRYSYQKLRLTKGNTEGGEKGYFSSSIWDADAICYFSIKCNMHCFEGDFREGFFFVTSLNDGPCAYIITNFEV